MNQQQRRLRFLFWWRVLNFALTRMERLATYRNVIAPVGRTTRCARLDEFELAVSWCNHNFTQQLTREEIESFEQQIEQTKRGAQWQQK